MTTAPHIKFDGCVDNTGVLDMNSNPVLKENGYESGDGESDELKSIWSNSLDTNALRVRKEVCAKLNREVTRHLFPGGIDVVVQPATPRTSPLPHMKAPRITSKPSDMDLVVGDTAKFEVVVEHKGASDCYISWSKAGQLLLGNMRIKQWQIRDDDDHVRFFMEIRKVRPEDESMYEFVVRNQFAETERFDVQLLVDEPITSDEGDEDDEDEEADEEEVEKDNNITTTNTELENNINHDEIDVNLPIFTKSPVSKTVVREGDAVSLEATVESTCECVVSWYWEGRKLKPSEGIQITSTKLSAGSSAGNYTAQQHCLLIEEALEEDGGMYECVARTEHGELSVHSEVEVIGEELDDKEEQ